MTHRAERSRSMSFPRRVVAGTSDSLRSTNTQDSTILLQRPLELRFRPLTAAWPPFPEGPAAWRPNDCGEPFCGGDPTKGLAVPS